jgi:hypothetical protein
MVTFTINIPPMLAYIPYMDPMGLGGQGKTQLAGNLFYPHPPVIIIKPGWLENHNGKITISSGKHTKNYGKSPFSMGKSTISMAIFNSYVSLPEGINWAICILKRRHEVV